MAAGFHSSINNFLHTDNNYIVGLLANRISAAGISTQYSMQIKVWGDQVDVLKQHLGRLLVMKPSAENWHIALEYELPRRQKRPDVILLADDVIFVLEFKFGMEVYNSSARWQAEDYALNLRDFHAQSSSRLIVPVLVATDAPSKNCPALSIDGNAVLPVQVANTDNLSERLYVWYEAAHRPKRESIDPQKWLNSVYKPTLTIIEAAERLYENHDVREITHSYAANLDKTTDMIMDVILGAKTNGKHCICFITGVPGAGKTLTGLNVVHNPAIRSKQGPSGIFLSGNGPLVKIIREALVFNQRQAGRRRQDCEHEVTTFIQNVHQFLRYHRENNTTTPHEHVVVFDEAQRAWNRHQMNRKQGVDASEPSLLLEVMERLDDWAVVIALVGGGQEIFLGEAGLEEWGRAILSANRPWSIVASPEVLKGGASVAGHRLFDNGLPEDREFQKENLAHLVVSVRSHRAQMIAEWVNDILEPNSAAASSKIPDSREFPLVVTRDLTVARKWLRMRSCNDPNMRCGLVTTSEDQRLRAYGLETSSAFRSDYPFEKWFLASPDDVRSSFFLEVPASEFECQGLELDWVGVCWGGDLTPGEYDGQWEYRKFRGSGWQNCHLNEERAYIRNRYRVLLTRARSGMIIWVPSGSPDDHTRDSARFDRVYEHLKASGVPDMEPIEDTV